MWWVVRNLRLDCYEIKLCGLVMWLVIPSLPFVLYTYFRDLTPVANAANSVTHLHTILAENKPEPSQYILSLCDITVVENLRDKVTVLSSKFLQSFNQV